MKNIPAYIKILGISTIINVLILFIRNYLTENTSYNFLLWNLFLGFVPFLFAYLLNLLNHKINKFFLWIGTGLWLLFYPNAPYMITDLIHIQATSPIVLYDAIIIFSLAMLSVFFGFYSIGLVYVIWEQKIGIIWTRIIIGASILLSSFGIYLGRILRLNSWDIFTKPIQTIELIFQHLFPVSANPTTYAIIIIFSWVQIMLIFLIIDMKSIRNK